MKSDELLQEFTDTHNRIIQSLNAAEKGHADTLETFIAELEKRKTAITDANTAINQFNELVRIMSARLEDTNRRINELNVLSGSIEFTLKKMQENVTATMRDFAKTAFKDFFKKSWLLLLLNLAVMIAVIMVVIFKN